jgi:hypothetical protein
MKVLAISASPRKGGNCFGNTSVFLFHECTDENND